MGNKNATFLYKTEKSRVQPGEWKTRPELIRFIHELCKDGHVCNAAKRAKTCRVNSYKWRYNDPDFADTWNQARLIGLEVLKDHAHKLAYEGVSRNVYFQGEKIDEYKEYSEGLLKFLIQQADTSYNPANRVELTGAGGAPFVFEMALHPAAQIIEAPKDQIDHDDG